MLFHNTFIPPPYFRQVSKGSKVAAVLHVNGTCTRTTPAPFRFAKAFRTKRFENLIFRKIFPVINSPECKLLAPWRTSCMTKWGAAKHEDENSSLKTLSGVSRCVNVAPACTASVLGRRKLMGRERTAGVHGECTRTTT